MRLAPVGPVGSIGCAVIGALVGCGYQPGSFGYPLEASSGQRATVGCLDVAIERRADLPLGPVVSYRFANRCDHPATVDIGAVVVIGRDVAGREARLAPYDPRGELRPAALDARDAGGEALAYPAARTLPQICVDAAGLAHEAPARWLCFAPHAPAVVGSAP